MLLHAKHASTNYRSMVFVIENTYMFIICLDKWQYVYLMWNKDIISEVGQSLGEVSQSLGEYTCKALQGLHTFTGCNSVGAFIGRRAVST